MQHLFGPWDCGEQAFKNIVPVVCVQLHCGNVLVLNAA